MKQLIAMTTLLLLVSCGQNPNAHNAKHDENSDAWQAKPQEQAPVAIALAFINAYVENCNKPEGAAGIIDWVNANPLTTKHFKTELKRIIEEADKEDPELGLGFDPIFDAQDYPEEGFDLAMFDSSTNVVVVQGRNWAEFKLSIRLVTENDKWLVDACGIVNAPND